MIKLQKVISIREENQKFIKGQEYDANVSKDSIKVYDPILKQWYWYSNRYLSAHLSIFLNFAFKEDTITYVKNKRELKEFITK